VLAAKLGQFLMIDLKRPITVEGAVITALFKPGDGVSKVVI